MVILFINENDFCYYKNYLYNHRYKFSSDKEQVNESQYIVSRLDSVRIRHSSRIGNGGVTLLPNEFSCDPCSQGKLIVRPSFSKIIYESPLFFIKNTWGYIWTYSSTMWTFSLFYGHNRCLH